LAKALQAEVEKKKMQKVMYHLFVTLMNVHVGLQENSNEQRTINK